MIRVKMGSREVHNHFVANSRGTGVTPERVMAPVEKYDQIYPQGLLYGAIIASVRDYFKTKSAGKYPEYHLAFCAHYVTDLSQPLHNIEHSPFNQRDHSLNSGSLQFAKSLFIKLKEQPSPNDYRSQSSQNGRFGQPLTSGRKVARKQAKISPAGRGLSQDSLGLFPKDRRVLLIIDGTRSPYPAFHKVIPSEPPTDFKR
jgi:hypothetical protein